ncbi:MAG: DUF4178 domain-containing protein [Candidatus Melainabacteria bacterium]|nr:DUF4178 domain-containing protein [Candidatus Melainabacteria bacterium]
MEFFFLLLALVGLGGGIYLLTQLAANGSARGQLRDEGTPNRLPDGSGLDAEALRIENVMAGGVIHLTGVGETLEEFDLQVTARHRYSQGGYHWMELECDRGDRTFWLTVEQDDGLCLSLGLETLRLEDLNLTKDALARMDEEETGRVEYNGQTFFLEDSDRAVFYRSGETSRPEPFYYWDFATRDERQFISVERWEDGGVDVTWGVALRPSQLTVYRLREEETAPLGAG